MNVSSAPLTAAPLFAKDPTVIAVTDVDPSPVTLMPGKKPNFVADLYMEQTKSFAKVAEQVYKAAVEEARHKNADKNRLHGFAEEVRDAKEALTNAAKAVEGPPPPPTATTRPERRYRRCRGRRRPST